MTIPNEAVEAAYDKYEHLGLNASEIEGILEVAAPHMLTRITNSVINRAYEDGHAAGLKEAHQVIPAEAVEAAAGTIFQNRTGRPFSDVQGGPRNLWLNEAREALEAAAPYMQPTSKGRS